ncbi:MAG TPA: winged helix-turn-helix transcriptional regulator, partial [Chitinophagaceae bacterium]
GGAIEPTERQYEIIELIKDNPQISYRKAAEILKINYSAAQAHFDALKNKGIIKREGGTRGYWKILNINHGSKE